MPRVILKETITKEIDVPMDVLYKLVDSLTEEERQKLMEKLKSKESIELKSFKKDELVRILSDFASTGIYEEDFLKDLEEGLKKSSLYR